MKNSRLLLLNTQMSLKQKNHTQFANVAKTQVTLLRNFGQTDTSKNKTQKQNEELIAQTEKTKFFQRKEHFLGHVVGKGRT